MVNSKSKSVYLYGIVKYILWLHADNPDIVDPSLWILVSSVVAEDDDEAYKQKQQHVKAFMASNSTQSPVNLLVAKVNDFECFLMSLRKKDGKSPGKSVYSLKRTVVRRQQEDGESLVEGKMSSIFVFPQAIQNDA
ncbi:hypothetical protein GQ600_24852 [Phytophthora cactorum]|nr:hypothetical protein GQ600_24852 [Phytophthora cactorum]